jgi:hypothetical protein
MALPTANDKGNKKGKKSAASMLQNSKFGGKTAKPVNISKKPIKTGGTRGS